ncbi:MAG: sigma-54-dependent Fis family transcriptional regulator [Candidatus Schekmanbacteria bacterium]|nr:sigma-54-dependent Fis family transcriptional regulator [Candidatus Schekmanbacteria bacterium]
MTTSPTSPPDVLLVEDDPSFAEMMRQMLGRLGCAVRYSRSVASAIEQVRRSAPALAFVDYYLPDGIGLDVLRQLASLAPDTLVIVVTGEGDERLALQALEENAFSYLPKPVDLAELGECLRDALEVGNLRSEIRRAREAAISGFLAGSSPAMRRIRAMVERVALSDATVLVQGETGTGKEAVAQALHFASPRATGPWVSMSCAATPETLFETEMFGHVPGAFTGATARRLGRFLSASGGTLLMDEIAELPLGVQPGLLRVLESREVLPLGATTPVAADFRLVVASSKPLFQEVAEGRFLPELYYRLEVITIELPPLRERLADIPELVRHFLPRLAARIGIPEPEPAPGFLESLHRYPWGGNIRELRNTLERLMVQSLDGVLRPVGLPEPRSQTPQSSFFGEKRRTVDAFEREYLIAVLQRTGGRLADIPAMTGISRRQLHNLLRKHNLVPSRSGAADE